MSHWSLCAFILRLGKCKSILTISFLCNLFRFISFVLVWEEYEYVRPFVHIPLALAVHTGGLTNNNKKITKRQPSYNYGSHRAPYETAYTSSYTKKRGVSGPHIQETKQNKNIDVNTTSTIGGFRSAVGLWSPIVADAAAVSAAGEEEETAVKS